MYNGANLRWTLEFHRRTLVERTPGEQTTILTVSIGRLGIRANMALGRDFLAPFEMEPRLEHLGKSYIG